MVDAALASNSRPDDDQLLDTTFKAGFIHIYLLGKFFVELNCQGKVSNALLC
jgi:hypothetical protein